MIFKRSVQRYGRTPEPETPYQRAGQVWDERIGSARVQAQSWRLMAFLCLALAAGLACALVWASGRSRVVPYVVAVDRLGAPRAIAPAETEYRPNDIQIGWHLARFVEQVRTVSLDPVLMRRDWLAAYHHATRRGAAYLTAYARAADPFTRIGERTISVQVTSVVRASERAFQIEWTESAFERGVFIGRSHWTGILTIEVRGPRDAETLRRNPLGLYVDAIDWSRELDVPPAAAEPQRPAQPGLPLGSPLDPTLAEPSSKEMQP